MTDSPLAELRREVAATDGRTIAEIARRLALAREIGKAKGALGLPLRDYALEREVVGRWVTGLAQAGVPQDRAELFSRWLVEEAVAAQEAQTPDPCPGAGDGQRALVVGGLGRMGQWISEYLETAGYRVAVVDPRPPPEHHSRRVLRDLREGTEGADLVVVATPMRQAAAVYAELLETGSRAVLFDILSVKTPILPLIRRGVARGYHLTSAHPLFGPGSRSLFGRNLLVLDCGDPLATEAVAGLFARSALRVTQLPIEQHDQLMVEVLGLPHLMSLLFARALASGGRRPDDFGPSATTSFRRIAEVAALVTGENPELVADIQILNPATSQLFERLEASLRELKQSVASGRPPAYEGLLEEGRAYLAGTGP